MAFGTFFFSRTGLKLRVTVATLLVKGIRPFRLFFITFIRIMALSAGLSVFIFIF